MRNPPEKSEIFRGGYSDWKQQAFIYHHMVPSPFSWPNLPAESTGTLKCAPSPPPNKVNQLLSGPPQPHNGPQEGTQGD